MERGRAPVAAHGPRLPRTVHARRVAAHRRDGAVRGLRPMPGIGVAQGLVRRGQASTTLNLFALGDVLRIGWGTLICLNPQLSQAGGGEILEPSGLCQEGYPQPF